MKNLQVPVHHHVSLITMPADSVEQSNNYEWLATILKYKLPIYCWKEMQQH
jgi:hypothetical protein